MPDYAELAAAVEGIRRDRHLLAKRAHRLGLSAGLLLVRGVEVDHVVDLAGLAYVQTRHDSVVFVALDGSSVESNSTYTLDGVLALLADYPRILRTRDDTLINFVHVRGIGRAATLHDGKLVYLAQNLLPPLPLAHAYVEPVRKFLGLTTLEHVFPWNDRYQALLDWNIRTFDDDIHDMTAERLVQEFHHPSTGEIDHRQLMANIIWQYHAWLDIPIGQKHHKKPVDGNIRTFWYYMKPVLSRVGGFDPDALYETMLEVFQDCVDRDRLFHYRDFDFTDEKESLRSIGDRYPHIIVVAEKSGHYTQLKKLQAEFGFTIMALRGQPSVLSGEYFCDELALVIPDLKTTTLRLIFMVDFDPSGHIISHAFQDRLDSFGSKHQTRADIVLPSRFSSEELPNVTYNIPLKTKGDRTKARKWIADFGGGIDGQPIGIEGDALIFADKLHDVVAELFAEAKKPAPLQTEYRPHVLADWGLPGAFSAELLAEDEAGFWQSWAESQETTAPSKPKRG
jgi:hypothetical protein